MAVERCAMGKKEVPERTGATTLGRSIRRQLRWQYSLHT